MWNRDSISMSVSTSAEAADKPSVQIEMPLTSSQPKFRPNLELAKESTIPMELNRDLMRWSQDWVAKRLGQANATMSFSHVSYAQNGRMVLNNVSGFVKPGEMLAVIGNGEDTTALLEILTQRRNIPAKQSTTRHFISGEVLVNGVAPSPAFNRTVAFVPKTDLHLPTLTVRETLMTSARLRTPRGTSEAEIVRSVETVMKLLSIERCQDTLVGDAVLRGISGGEKRRLSVGVELVAGHSVIVADEPTNGLDSKTAFDVCASAKAICATGKSFVASLVQPSPDLLKLFDNVLLLSKGSCFYFGRAKDCEEYMEAAGFTRPSVFSVPEFLEQLVIAPEKFYDGSVPLGCLANRLEKVDHTFVADSVMANPEMVFKHLLKHFVHSEQYRQMGEVLWSDFTSPLLAVDQATTEEFVKKHHPGAVDYGFAPVAGGDVYASSMKDIGDEDMEQDPFADAYAHGQWFQFKTLMRRQMTVSLRNKELIQARVVNSLMNVFILATVFYNVDNSVAGALDRFSVIFIAVSNMGFASLSTIPLMQFQRGVYYRQHSAGYYHQTPYFLTQLMTEVPFTLVAMALFSWPLYALVGMDGGFGGEGFWFFYAMMCMMCIVSWSYCFFLSSALPDAATTQSVASLTLLSFMLLAGFTIPKDSIPSAWKWLHYASFMALPLRAMCVMEYRNLEIECRPDELLPPASAAADFGGESNFLCPMTSGADFMRGFDIDVDADSDRVWSLLALMFVFLAVFNVLGYLCMRFVNHQDVNVPQREVKPKRRPEPVHQEIVHQEHDHSGVYLSFKDLSYTVRVKGPNASAFKSDWVDKPLLQAVNGFAKPGSLIALMGPSGAGKSTLLDVLANRKTAGTMQGELLINGKPRDRHFLRMSAYVEQFDSLCAEMTVRESIIFSAKLRLGLPKEGLKRLAADLISKLALEEVADRLIGTPETGGIGPLLRKKTSIALELICDPHLIFLDEPTTGLDSSSASAVMHTVKALVADTTPARTIICTIHQPSHEIFSMFDGMLLLAKGKMVYFGSVDEMNDYFHDHNFYPCKEGKNPADYALEIAKGDHYAGSGGDTGGKRVHVDGYKNDDLIATREWDESHESGNAARSLDEGIIPSDYRPPTFEHEFATSIRRQVQLVTAREFNRAKRNTAALLITRIISPLFISLLIGSIYWNLEQEQIDGRNRVSASFMIAMMMCFFPFMEIPNLVADRVMYFREKNSGHYSAFSYWAGKLLAQQPFIISTTLLMLVPAYFLTNMEGNFWLAGLSLMMCFHVSNGLGNLLSYIAPTAEAANLGFTSTIASTTLFVGFMMPLESIPAGWKWLHYNFFTWGFRMIVSNEFNDLEFNCDNGGAIPVPVNATLVPDCVATDNGMCIKEYCPIVSGEEWVDVNYEVNTDAFWEYTLYMVGWIVALYTFSLLGLRFKKTLNR